jgi:hypothetical protein
LDDLEKGSLRKREFFLKRKEKRLRKRRFASHASGGGGGGELKLKASSIRFVFSLPSLLRPPRSPLAPIRFSSPVDAVD